MRIVIDPGHGGCAPAGSSTPYGARSVTGAHEKDVVLRLAELVAGRLGGAVQLTRSADHNLEIGARQRASSGADAFLSLHASARTGRRNGGLWVHPDGPPDSRGLARALQGALGRIRSAPPIRDTPTMAVLDPTRLPATMPAALLEVDVLGNPESEGEVNLDRIAQAIADGLAEWEERRSADESYGAPDRHGIQNPPVTYTNATDAARAMAQWLADLGAFLTPVPQEKLAVFPHASVAYIEVDFGGGVVGFGSGSYIAADRVVTAAHLFSARINNNLVYARRFRVSRAHHPGVNTSALPWVDMAGNVSFAAGWGPTEPTGSDMAVCKVPSQGGVTPFTLGEATQSGQRVLYIGYPAARGAELVERQQSVSIPRGQQRVSPGTIRTATDNFNVLHLDAPTQGGVSGAPLLRVENGRFVLIGVHNGIDATSALACAMTPAKRAWATGAFRAAPWPPGAPAAGAHALEVDTATGEFAEPHGASESYGGEARYGTPWGVVRHYVSEGLGGAAVADDRDWYADEDLVPGAVARPHTGPPASSARQADDAVSPDFRHIGVAGLSQAYSLTATHLQALARANDFDVTAGQDEVVFGLRGARLVDAATRGRWATSVSLSEDVFDHYGFHCVIGVWRRSTGEIAAFNASTVPNRRHMERQRAAGAGAQIANMLPTGRYLLSVGRHRAVPNALILPGTVVVIRSNDDLVYTTRDVFEKHAPADNIHPSFSDRDAQFSSAGCQTVPGNYSAATSSHSGDWATFRTLAGFASRDGQRYVYLLLTGREARLCSQGRGAPRRLRFGSNGAAVRQLQDALRTAGHYSGTTDGSLGADSVMALVAWQRAQPGAAGAADGILTPAAAGTLRVTLT